MKVFNFKFTCTPVETIRNGEYVRPDFWVDIRNQVKEIEAENLNEAIKAFQEFIDNKWCVTISKTAVKRPQPMYIDVKGSNEPKQVGLVFKGSMDIDFDERGWKKRFIDVWTEIHEFTDVEFDAA